MENSQDTILFCEVIETEGARFLGLKEVDGEQFHCYSGPVYGYQQICVSDEFIYNKTAKRILQELGMHNLIEKMHWG